MREESKIHDACRHVYNVLQREGRKPITTQTQKGALQRVLFGGCPISFPARSRCGLPVQMLMRTLEQPKCDDQMLYRQNMLDRIECCR